MKSVAVIGAGITGLTCAFRLRQQNNPVTLYEASGRVGGPIQTLRSNGYLAEFGPNTIIETSPRIRELIQDLGLESRRLYSDGRAANRYLVRNGVPVALPSSLGKFLSTCLFSGSAKMRLALEPFIRKSDPSVEE